MALIELQMVPDAELEARLVGTGLSLSTLAGWYVSAHRWAACNGYQAGMPTFLWDRAPNETDLNKYRWKTVCFKAGCVTVASVLETERLRATPASVSSLATLKDRHLAAHNWARANGFASGFPTHDRPDSGSNEHFTLCFADDGVDLRDAPEAERRQWMVPFFEFESPNGRQAAAHFWARARHFLSGYPTYEQRNIPTGTLFGTFCIRSK